MFFRSVGRSQMDHKSSWMLDFDSRVLWKLRLGLKRHPIHPQEVWRTCGMRPPPTPQSFILASAPAFSVALIVALWCQWESLSQGPKPRPGMSISGRTLAWPMQVPGSCPQLSKWGHTLAGEQSTHTHIDENAALLLCLWCLPNIITVVRRAAHWNLEDRGC